MTRTLADLGLKPARGGADTPVLDLALDSRRVRPGALFAALPGARAHGAEFVTYALRMGAGSVLTDRAGAQIAAEALDRHPGAALVVAEDAREAFARACALWFDAQPATMVAVTGTNGKTSVASFARQIWQGLGHRAVNIGTTGVEGDWTAALGHTTPDSLTLHATLREAARAGVTHAAMEASSHGLDQRRLDGVRLLAGGFTNLSQDHLDYHGDMETYFAAKRGLFERVLPPEATAVVNLDDPYGARLAGMLGDRPMLRVGSTAGCDLRIAGQQYQADGQILRLEHRGAAHQVRLALVGGFQAWNVLVALGLVIAAGADPGAAIATLGRLGGVRGRMQLAATRANGAAVYVDYAHTPAAVETALKALRPHVLGRLIVVLGAGGDRDRSKRPLMGAAAAAEADIVYVTDDNPRSEDPAAIRAAILAAAPEAHEVGDRAEAILRAVDALEAGDALIILGKGHETGQTVGTTVYPFDDIEQASVAVAALDGRGG